MNLNNIHIRIRPRKDYLLTSGVVKSDYFYRFSPSGLPLCRGCGGEILLCWSGLSVLIHPTASNFDFRETSLRMQLVSGQFSLGVHCTRSGLCSSVPIHACAKYEDN